MTFWLDEHLDPELAPWLGATFKVIVKTLKECGLHGEKDLRLYEAARRFSPVVIVTKDTDFVELIHRKGHPPQVLLLISQIWQRLACRFGFAPLFQML